jgi:hypothetical protein
VRILVKIVQGPDLDFDIEPPTGDIAFTADRPIKDSDRDHDTAGVDPVPLVDDACNEAGDISRGDSPAAGLAVGLSSLGRQSSPSSPESAAGTSSFQRPLREVRTSTSPAPNGEPARLLGSLNAAHLPSHEVSDAGGADRNDGFGTANLDDLDDSDENLEDDTALDADAQTAVFDLPTAIGDPDPEEPYTGAVRAAILARLSDEALATRLSVFVWVLEFGISTKAYRCLMDLLHREGFNVDDLPLDIATLKQFRKVIPLVETVKTEINLKPRMLGTGRKSRASGQAYSLKLDSLVKRLFNNKRLTKLMHFGLGERPHVRTQPWHGEGWHESILSSLSDYPLPNACGSALLPIIALSLINSRTVIHPGAFVRIDGHEGDAGVSSHLCRITAVYRDGDEIMCELERALSAPSDIAWDLNVSSSTYPLAISPNAAVAKRRLFLELPQPGSGASCRLESITSIVDVLVWREEVPARLQDLGDAEYIVDVSASAAFRRYLIPISEQVVLVCDSFCDDTGLEQYDDDDDAVHRAVEAEVIPCALGTAGRGRHRGVLLPALCLRKLAAELELESGAVDLAALGELRPEEVRTLTVISIDDAKRVVSATSMSSSRLVSRRYACLSHHATLHRRAILAAPQPAP